ncbi:MAG: serine/threonine protein kinase [Gammaproteobacteria bacterium]|nr:serine/threonine protein kinase [Gammaproteobacteria bacterium]MBU1439943.1 serine/threonine protein kinase [Gammaproteobacteria bacterium]MBU2284803.1 serine/threonine protein kinase [Gammaproteobacteria bacterium]
MKQAIVLASLLAIAGVASAQTTSQPATGNVAGQASTQTPAGVPNPPQRPEGAAMSNSTNSMPNSRADVKAGARVQAQSPQTTTIPSGQASTKVQGKPNAAMPVGERSRGEVRQETKQSMRDNKMTRSGEAPDVPTNPKDSRMGTPK